MRNLLNNWRHQFNYAYTLKVGIVLLLALALACGALAAWTLPVSDLFSYSYSNTLPIIVDLFETSIELAEDWLIASLPLIHASGKASLRRITSTRAHLCTTNIP